MYEKKGRNTYLVLRVDGKREIACFHVETATGKREHERTKTSRTVSMNP